ncbi:hypothetical protein [Algoriphagus mannitolivorans]|nr:hypothetical protein [Algoriphagus mannitolivorans]
MRKIFTPILILLSISFSYGQSKLINFKELEAELEKENLALE